MFGFMKKKRNSFPSDMAGRRETILSIHRYVSKGDDVADMGTIDLLLDLVSDVRDPFVMSAYVIYYIGIYKPFSSGNEETAGRIVDMILADGGWVIPRVQSCRTVFDGACTNEFTIEEITDWERGVAERIGS